MSANDRYEIHQVDILVVGAGGAGLRAAIEAAKSGLKVGVVCKSLLGKAHTVMAEGGIAAALGNTDPEDNWKEHFRDTMYGGKFLNDWRFALKHAQLAPECVLELQEWGALFDRTEDGRILQRAFGGHSWRRLAHVGDRTGLEMIRTLQDKLLSFKNVDVFQEATIIHILKDGNSVSGAVGYWRETGRFLIFKTPAIILATGGMGKIYEVTSNSWEYTGSGYALALFAGAELRDMEFTQFHPTGMVWPPSVKGILVTEAVRGEGGRLYNSKKERFMQKYDPVRLELSTRDLVARSIYTEIKEGRGTEHGGVYLDVSHLPAEVVKKKLPGMYKQFLQFAGIDITKEPMEVAPTMHYTMGGVVVDPETQMTRVQGLFAAGEVASGLHGANRLGGNSLSDLLVFGKLAGKGAAEYVSSLKKEPKIDKGEVDFAIKDSLKYFEEKDGVSPYDIHDELKKTMQNLVGIFREEKDMKKALEKIYELKEKKIRVNGNVMFNPAWHLAIDLKFMLLCAECVTISALERKDSVGAHSRLDYPNESKEKYNQFIELKNGSIQLRKEPTLEVPDELKALLKVPPSRKWEERNGNKKNEKGE
ncbi:MAG: FAD-binding protein [Candidatus Calescibacterium sp.]|nr:FAD-binding protein [Candidatus Calescibacterium sp.]MCX7734593.1 FAD-binding protein [bacterium]MDW8086519.1 FAD-binding protein [Candidatus Calescibacterium sp.]